MPNGNGGGTPPIIQKRCARGGYTFLNKIITLTCMRRSGRKQSRVVLQRVHHSSESIMKIDDTLYQVHTMRDITPNDPSKPSYEEEKRVGDWFFSPFMFSDTHSWCAGALKILIFADKSAIQRPQSVISEAKNGRLRKIKLDRWNSLHASQTPKL